MKKASLMAGIKANEIGFAEVYDAYAGAQFQAIKALGLSSDFLKDFRDGHFSFDGKLPLNHPTQSSFLQSLIHHRAYP